MGFGRLLLNYRSTLILILTPLVFLPIPLVYQNTESSCAYCIILMAIYWIAETLPLAVTAFLPLILFPLMGIMKAGEVSVVYMKDTLWLFVGGLLVAVAVEHTGLHRRIAFGILRLAGTKPHSLMFGFMLPTFFLSMWISNTATTAMMLPIVEAVIAELSTVKNIELETTGNSHEIQENGMDDKNGQKYTYTNFCMDREKEMDEEKPKAYETDSEMEEIPIQSDDNESTAGPKEIDNVVASEAVAPAGMLTKKISIGLTICVPYAASVGGIATLTGTGGNLVLAGQYEILFPDADPKLSFGIWFAYNFPVALTLLLFLYIWLAWLFLGFNYTILSGLCKKQNSELDKRIKAVIMREYNKLGKIRWSEITVTIVLVITVLLWFFREPGFMPGWAIIFPDDFVSDGTVAMTMGTLLFILPSERPMFFNLAAQSSDSMKPVKPILDWPTVHKMMPWNVMFLLGGGFALAEGATVSGFSQWLGNQLAVLADIPEWALCLIVTIVACLFTECTSNVATASLFIPIIAELAQATQTHPLYLLMPTIVGTSLAFMLPVATPPNAIAFSFGRLTVLDMVKAGWFVNILGIAVLMLYINTYGMVLFGLDEFPEWAYPENSTTGI